MEQRLHYRLQVQANDGLSNPVRDSWHTERPHSLVCLRYLHGTHRRREVTPRGHPIPDSVEVPFQVLLELRNRLPVDTRGSLIRLDLLECVPDRPFGNVKRLCL